MTSSKDIQLSEKASYSDRPAYIEHAILDTGIDYSARAMEKPSDHCPIWLELK